METVKFAKRYDHPTATGHIAYAAGETATVSNDTAAAARRLGKLDETAPSPKRERKPRPKAKAKPAPVPVDEPEPAQVETSD